MKLTHRVICLGVATALALPVATTATARDNGSVVELVAQATGLTVRQVQMVLGYRTSFAEYPISYEFVDQRLLRSVGPETYQHLKDGEVTSWDLQNLTTMREARANRQVAVAETHK